jgi:hypothetical protein
MRGRAYRRKTIAEAGQFETVAAIEDDFHHFAVRLRHDGSRVTELTGEAVRFPWSTCPGAVAKLDELIGAPLFPTPADPGPRPPIAEQCTHLFDIAKFAIAQSARAQSGQGRRRQYDIVIPDPDGGSTTGDLSRDGVHLLHWVVEKRVIVAPAAFAGHQLRRQGGMAAGQHRGRRCAGGSLDAAPGACHLPRPDERISRSHQRRPGAGRLRHLLHLSAGKRILRPLGDG